MEIVISCLWSPLRQKPYFYTFHGKEIIFCLIWLTSFSYKGKSRACCHGWWRPGDHHWLLLKEWGLILGVTQAFKCFMPKSCKGAEEGCLHVCPGQLLPLGAAAAQLSQRHGRRACVIHFPRLRLESILLSWFQAAGELVQVSDCSDDHRHWNTLQALCVVCMSRLCTLRPSWARYLWLHQQQTCCFSEGGRSAPDILIQCHNSWTLQTAGRSFALCFHLNSSCFFLNPTVHMPLVLSVPAKYPCSGFEDGDK